MSVALAAASTSFWSSSASAALVAAVCALVVGCGVALALRSRARRSGIRERVAEFLNAAEAATGEEPLRRPEPTSPKGLRGALELALEREHWWEDFKRSLDVAGLDRSPVEVISLTISGSLMAGLVLWALTKNAAAMIPGLLVAPLVTRFVVRRGEARQRNMFSEQLPAHLQELAAAMRVGHSMVSGLGVVAEGASEPTRGEFQRILADEQLGLPLQEAIRSSAERMGAEDMKQVSLVAELHAQTGGNMAEVLDRVAEAVRERAELNRELRTLTAQARGSRWIVTLMPPGLLLVIDLLNPAYLNPLFNTETGNLLIGVAVVLMVLGSLVMGRIVKIEV